MSLSDLVVMDNKSEHILMDESLSLLFIAYTDSSFAIYLLDRMAEMLINGFVLSDTAIVIMVQDRLTREDIIKIIHDEQEGKI